MAVSKEQANLDRICENIHLAKLSVKIVSWEKYPPFCELHPGGKWELKQTSRQYDIQKWRVLERWKERSGDDATYRNLARIFEAADDQMLADFVYKLAQDHGKTEPQNYSEMKPRFTFVMVLATLITFIFLLGIIYYRPMFLHSSVKHEQYIENIKHRYKTYLPNVAQSFWLPANMHTFIQLSLTSRDKPRVPTVDQYSANQRIVSERSMTFDHLLSEIDASPGSRTLVVGQPGIGKTTLLQMITRSWVHGKALSSCWILLHVVLRDLVLLQHAPNLATFLSFMGNIWLPYDIETQVLKSDGKGLCFIVDGLDEYPAGYEDKTNFIFSLIRAQKLAQSTVVISSRPAVASQVWHLFDKHVEVLGFDDDQIDEYIQAKYDQDKSFSKYTDGHPHIKHTCYIPLHLAMLVYLKDSLLDNLPETETEVYEQFIIHTLIWDFCSKDPTSSCSRKNTLPTSLNRINESSEIGTLIFHIAKLAYIGIRKRQSIFTEVGPVLQHTNTSLLVVDKTSVLQPATYSFPHLTIQEFLAAFYFNTYLEQQEQMRVLVNYSYQQIVYGVDCFFWRFCCGLKRKKNQTTFLEFFNLLYQYNYWTTLPYHCVHEAQSLIASQQLLNFTGEIAKLSLYSYYDAASLAFVAVSAAHYLREITFYESFFLRKLCDTTTKYPQLRRVKLEWIDPSNIGCLLQNSPHLKSLDASGFDWFKLQSEDAAALILPSYGTKLLNIRHIQLNYLNIGDKGVIKLSQLLQDSIFLETLSLCGNGISDNGVSTIADLMKVLPRLRRVYLDGNHIGDKGVEKLSQVLRDSISLQTLSLKRNGISDNGASTIADLIEVLPRLRHVYLSQNHIGGHGAALLWNQSIHKCCNLDLDWNVIGDDRPDAFVNVLNGTISNGYKGNKSCQLLVSVIRNKFLCSDLRDILNNSKQLPKGVMLITGDYCLNMTEWIFKYW